MNRLTVEIRAAIAVWIGETTGRSVPAERVCPSREAPLACGAFVCDGADDAARLLMSNLGACVHNGTALLSEVREQRGWLLLFYTDALWQLLQQTALALAAQPADGIYADARMRTLMRHGAAPCPDDGTVRGVLWDCWLCHDAGRQYPPQLQRRIERLTHHRTGAARIALEHACGSVAAAILNLRGDII